MSDTPPPPRDASDRAFPPPPPQRDSSGHAFPPPPPPVQRTGGGCVRYGLIGCGILLALFVVAAIAVSVWFGRNRGVLEETTRAAAQEGARFGLAADEATCLEEGARRSGGVVSVSSGLEAGSWVRACLEFSRDTPGFCDGVPAPTSIRGTVAWQTERCGDDTACRSVISVVQTYCTEGRPKRTPADTLQWAVWGTGADAEP